MDPLVLTIVLRASERLLVVAAAALAIWLGYRLFLSMPEQDRGKGEVKLPGGISIYLSRVGPGAFFALFGAIVIGMSLAYGIRYADELPQMVQAAGEREPAARRRELTGIGGIGLGGGGVSASERELVLASIETLNGIEGRLRDDLPQRERAEIRQAVREAKLRLLAAVWDERWGRAEDFRQWVFGGEKQPPPGDVADAAAVWAAGGRP